jgi:hypothetical protein
VAKRVFDPARLTVVIGGNPAEGRGAPQIPAPLPPGKPPQPPAGLAAQTQGVTAQGVMSAPKPADKPLVGPVTTPKAAKKP